MPHLLVDLDDAWHRKGDGQTERDRFINDRALIRVALDCQSDRHIGADDRRIVAGPAAHEMGSPIGLIAVWLV